MSIPDTLILHAAQYVYETTFPDPVRFLGKWRFTSCSFKGPVSFDDESTTFKWCHFHAGQPDGPLNAQTLDGCYVTQEIP